MTVLLGIGIGYLIWHDKPVQIVNKVDKVKVDSLHIVMYDDLPMNLRC